MEQKKTFFCVKKSHFSTIKNIYYKRVRDHILILMLRDDSNLVFEHVEKGGLASIIETEEENFGFFLPETKGGENAIEPVKEEHVWFMRSKAQQKLEKGNGGSPRSKVEE